MNTDNTIDTADQIIQQLEATKKEIELFINELNLNNVTAEERYQKLKQEFKSSVDEMKTLLDQKSPMPADAASALLLTLSELKERLEKSEENTTHDISELIKGIKKGLKRLGTSLVNDISSNEISEKIHHQLQRYKLKFEILKLKLALGTLKVKYVGKDMQYRLNLKIQALAKFLRESKHSTEEKIQKARSMVNKIYAAFGKIHT